MARIKVIQYEAAGEVLKTIYDDLIKQRGKLSEVLKIQSLNPDTIKSHMQLYLDVMFAQSPLSRAEREMIAIVVSVTNGCQYCQTHHAAALNNYWKEGERVQRLIENYKTAPLSEKELAMCVFAEHLTRHPNDHESMDRTIELKKHGLEDRAILDLVLVISYFNFVNRMVMGLGVTLEDHKGAGYNYE